MCQYTDTDRIASKKAPARAHAAMTSAVPTPQPALLPPCPLDAVRSKVDSALALGRSLVLQAEPGAGKSTRLPLWLLAAPWLRQHDKQGRILLLEPRRVAARALARYLARALDEDVGRTVGLRMRDETRVSHATKLEVLTEGVLTRLLQADPQLTDTACVIFDEFHERSLTSDTGLALCLESQAALRPDLRLVVMSATLDAAPVAALLGNCPVVTCPGRAYPVDIRYLPPRPETTGSPGGAPLLWRHMAAVIGELCRTEPGGLLAFLPGAGEIRQVAALLEGRLPPHTDLYPLYGNLSPQAQDAALAPSPPGRRKVVLATAIAETSLTIDGVRMVVDCGLARLARFDPASGLTRLVTERVSLAGAVQRAGRAGRTEPGLCCRLWRHAEDHGLRPTARPEILEADLCGLTLQLAVWGAEPTALPWLDPPPAAALTAARQTLQRLGALDPRGRATALGRRMAALPLDPRPARMLLGAQDQGHGPLACCLAALLAERDPLARAEAPQRAAGSIMRENSADLGKRLDWLCRPARAGRQDRSPLSDGMGHGGGAQARLRRQALRLAGLLRLKEDIFAVAAADHKHAGPVLAQGWPELTAQRQTRDGAPDAVGGARPGVTYLMRCGRAARLPAADSLSRSPFLAIAVADGASPHCRIRLAAPLEAGDLTALFNEEMVTEEHVAVSPSGQVTARRQTRLDALLLEDVPLPRPASELCAAALCDYVRHRGLNALPWGAAARQWRARVALLRDLEGEPWPDLSDAALLTGLETWLTPALAGCTALTDLNTEALSTALHSLLPGQLGRRLAQAAPTHWQVPSGALRPIVYGDDGGPWLAAKLQEFFGCVQTPAIADGRVPLTLHLNSPAGRPLQITRDLPHFWRHGYPAVRAEMRGRYPRHPWPEDPTTAPATALSAKRMAARTAKKG